MTIIDKITIPMIYIKQSSVKLLAITSLMSLQSTQRLGN